MGDEIRCTVIATGFERAGVPRRALERPTRNDKPVSHSAGTMSVSNTPFARSNESVNVSADYRSSSESKPASQPGINTDDLDVPTFLRNRR
jgi:hypothetical protein